MKGFLLLELMMTVLFLNIFVVVLGTVFPTLVDKAKNLRALQNKKIELTFLKRSLCVLGTYEGPLQVLLISENENQKIYRIEGVLHQEEWVCEKE